MKRFLKRIGCLLGYHHYAMRDMELIPFKEAGTGCWYIARCRCVDCGRFYSQSIKINDPSRR